MPRGTLRVIIDQAGLTVEEFLKLRKNNFKIKVKKQKPPAIKLAVFVITDLNLFFSLPPVFLFLDFFRQNHFNIRLVGDIFGVGNGFNPVQHNQRQP